MSKPPSSILTLMRHYLTKPQNPRHFTQTRIRPLLNGVEEEPDSDYSEVAKQVCNLITTQPSWQKSILSDHPPSTIFNPNCVAEIIRTQNDAFLSYRFFRWLRSNEGFSPDNVCCNVLFDELLQAKPSKVAQWFLHSVEFEPDPVSLETFVVCLCEDGNVTEAVRVFDKLKMLGYSPALEVWNLLLLASVEVGKTDLVWRLYSEMMECGVVGDASTVGYVIRGFCEDGKVGEAYMLLREVLQSGFVPDVVVFNKLISGFCKERDYGKVSALLHIMISKNCAPTIATYQQIIYYLCKDNMGEEGFRIFNDLKERGYTIDGVTYATMIDGLCKMKNMGEARKLWAEMLSKGFVPNEIVYNSLIRGYKSSDWVEALKLWKEMCDRGLARTTYDYNSIVITLCKHGHMDKAVTVVEEMQNMKIKPDAVTYGSLIKGFCRIGKMKAAMNFYHELLSTGLQLSVNFYHPLIKSLCDAGKTKDALDLWNDLQQRGQEPLDILSLIVAELFKQGNATVGKHWLAKMLHEKLRSPKESLDEIIQCLKANNLMDEALLVLQSISGMDNKLEESELYRMVRTCCETDSVVHEVCNEKLNHLHLLTAKSP